MLTASLQALDSATVIGGGSTVEMDRELTGLPKQTLRFWNWWSVKSSTAAGCYIYCTKEAFEAVGCFDERVYAAEELHLSKKLKKLAKYDFFTWKITSPTFTEAVSNVAISHYCVE